MDKMRLPRDGSEYVNFTFSPLPLPGNVVLEAQIGDTWYTIEQPVGSAPRLLVKGPNAPAGSSGVTVTKDGPLRVRIKSNPEVIVRGAGYIALVS